MKLNNTTKLVVAVLGSEAAGILGSIFTRASIPVWYESLIRPNFAPPNWIFGPVWITLYALMGVAAYLIWQKGLENNRVLLSLKIFIFQLILNTLWSVIFFGLQSPAAAFFEIIILWSAIMASIISFYSVSKTAAWLLIPYILWVTFAAFLNFAIWQLNY